MTLLARTTRRHRVVEGAGQQVLVDLARAALGTVGRVLLGEERGVVEPRERVEAGGVVEVEGAGEGVGVERRSLVVAGHAGHLVVGKQGGGVRERNESYGGDDDDGVHDGSVGFRSNDASLKLMSSAESSWE